MLKKIYEALVAIRTELQMIRNNSSFVVNDLEEVEIKTFCSNLSIQSMIISFSLTYHDWLKLEQSKEWKEFRRLLLKYQKRYNQMRQTKNQD